MDLLTSLALKYGTDKGCRDKDNRFTPYYHQNLSEIRADVERVLEIGVWKGKSLAMWAEYFENAKIYGIDTNIRFRKNDEKIETMRMDQSNKEHLAKLKEMTEEFDLIIDDGGHRMNQQQISLACLFDHVKSGGIYIVEDLHTSLPHHEQECGIDFGASPCQTNTTLFMLNRLKSGEPYSQGLFISEEEYNSLAENIASIDIYSVERKSGFLSITSIIKRK